MELERLLTVKELADYLHIKPLTIYRMLNDGRLTAVRIGKSVRFRPKDIETFLDASQYEPQKRPAKNQGAGKNAKQKDTAKRGGQKKRGRS